MRGSIKRRYEGSWSLILDLGYVTDPQTGLQTLRTPSGWIRDPQPLPVRIEFDPDTRPRGIRLGSQANVIIYTGDNPVMNALGWIWIRLVAWLTYVS